MVSLAASFLASKKHLLYLQVHLKGQLSWHSAGTTGYPFSEQVCSQPLSLMAEIRTQLLSTTITPSMALWVLRSLYTYLWGSHCDHTQGHKTETDTYCACRHVGLSLTFLQGSRSSLTISSDATPEMYVATSGYQPLKGTETVIPRLPGVSGTPVFLWIAEL